MSWDLLKELIISDIIEYHPNKKDPRFLVDDKRTVTGIFNGFIKCKDCSIGDQCKGRAVIDNNKPMCIGFGVNKCRIVKVIKGNFIEEDEFKME